MIEHNTYRNEQPRASASAECDWSTLMTLARRVIHGAALAVMVHGEFEACDPGAQDKDV